MLGLSKGDEELFAPRMIFEVHAEIEDPSLLELGANLCVVVGIGNRMCV